MILYSPAKYPPLIEYGIEIPVASNRSKQVFDALSSHPVLGPRIRDWHIKCDGVSLDKVDLLRVHSKEYIERLFSDKADDEIICAFELKDEKGRFYRYDPTRAKRPLSELAMDSLENASGVTQCCREALDSGFCFFLGGGHHHAHYDFGHGFCLLNDSVLALRKLQAEKIVETAWVIDVDAHKGDGTAALTQNDRSIVTLSVHMAGGWPLTGDARNERGELLPAFIPSNIDVPIERGEEKLYVKRLKKALDELACFPRPDLVIVISGSDSYEKDTLPSAMELKLTASQIYERDLLIWHFLTERQIPGAYLMAGGYGPDAWEVYPPFLEYVLLDNLNLDDPAGTWVNDPEFDKAVEEIDQVDEELRK
jgi:acetoin utilization deacetylase AcuC-like enzyme